MAEDGVIAAKVEVASPTSESLPKTPLDLVLPGVWLALSLALAWRGRWLREPTNVRWHLNLLENQILIACGVLLSGMVAAITAASLGTARGADPTPGVSLAALATSSGVTLGTWALLSLHASRLSGRRRASSPGMTAWRAAVAGLMGVALAWPAVALASRLGESVQRWAGGPPVPIVAHTTLEQLRTHASDPFAWVLAIAVVTLTPVTEEILWRGAVQQALKSAGLPRAIALVAASTLFALVHWNAVPSEARAGALPALLMLGLLFGWLLERTGRLLAPITAHAAFNAANLLLFSTLPG